MTRRTRTKSSPKGALDVLNRGDQSGCGCTYRLVVIALTLLVAACGGGDDTESPPDAPPPATTQPPSTTPPTIPSAQNRAPVIGGNPLSQVLVNMPYTFTPTVSDADGDSLTFSIQNKPSWATFNVSNGKLSGTPTAGDSAVYYNVRITVSDGTASATLGPFSVNVVTTATGAATLSWSAPTMRTDGSPLDEVAGYRVHWGDQPRTYTKSATVPKGVQSYVVEELTPGTWYFSVTAFDSTQIESTFSNEVSKQVL